MVSATKLHHQHQRINSRIAEENHKREVNAIDKRVKLVDGKLSQKERKRLQEKK